MATLHPVLPCLDDYIRAIQTGLIGPDRPGSIYVRDTSYVVSDTVEGGEVVTYKEGVVPVRVALTPGGKAFWPVRAVVAQGRVVAILTQKGSVA